MNRTFRRAAFASFPLLILSGCVTLDPGPSSDDAGKSATAAPNQLVAFWQPDVQFTPDPANGGAEKPTLFGRVYLFGPDLKYPMIGDGKLVVDLYRGPIPRDGAAQPLEEWRFDPATLKGLAKRDFLGWGYTVPLPWGTYRPDLTCVQMKVRYEPAKGAPLYADGAPMAVKNGEQDGGPVVTESAKPHG